MVSIEYFPVVNDQGDIIGKATRSECHSGSFLLHPVVHLHVFNKSGELFLQKRALDKDIQPGKWDTSVGGHVDFDEQIEHALIREVNEELGIVDFVPKFIKRYKFVSDKEAELVHSYYTIYDGPIQIDPIEISEGKFWKINDIENQIGKQVFTPNFEQEFKDVISTLTIIP
ncbi:MAG: NUDIX domain-containing protein [Paludibacter sp.]|nr:NUDIX domain-containing protein [Paludibacter sp.]